MRTYQIFLIQSSLDVTPSNSFATPDQDVLTVGSDNLPPDTFISQENLGALVVAKLKKHQLALSS